MRRSLFLLILGAAALAACADQPTAPGLDHDLAADRASPSRQENPADRTAYRVTGDFVSSQTALWFIFDRMVIRDLDAWVDREGNMGGSYYVEVYFVGDDVPLISEEVVTCLSVDPSTRQAWITSARPDPEWGTHYSLLQMRDLSPAAMSETGRVNSGRYDLYTGRTTPPWESDQDPHFCLRQPDLAQMPMEIPGGDPLPAMPLFPIDPGGDIAIRMGGSLD